MSDDGVVRDERGRIVKGSPGLHRKPEQQAQSTPTATAEPYLGDPDDSDAVIIYVARNFGRKGLPRDGHIGYYLWLMEERPADFNAQQSKAIARKAEAASPAGGAGNVQVCFLTAPSGMSVDAEGHLISEADAKAAWERKNGMVITEPPPAKPVLVSPIEDQLVIVDDDEASNDGGEDDEPPQRPGIGMNDLLRSIPPARFKRKRDDEW